MSLYDLVRVPCPKCAVVVYFQSKGSLRPAMYNYELADAPEDVLGNVNRHSPHQCFGCGTWFAVDETTRKAIRTEPPPEPSPPIDDWYRRHPRT